MELKGSKTEKNLYTAFTGEVQAHAKYLFYSDQAKKEGYEQISEIFKYTALNELSLEERLLRDFAARKNEQMKNVMRGLLPAGVIPLVLNTVSFSAEKQANSVTKEERRRLVSALKSLPLTPIKLRGFQEAVVTSGGVSVKEIDPATMESKIRK